MKFSIKYHKVFKKDLKPFKNDSALIAELRAVIEKLANDEILEPKYKDHALKGDFIGTRECHIKGDALLIYEKKRKWAYFTLLTLWFALKARAKIKAKF